MWQHADSWPSNSKVYTCKIIVTCTLLCCNLIARLLPHPVCGRGMNRLWMRLIDHIHICTEIFKKLILYRTVCQQKCTNFLHPWHGALATGIWLRDALHLHAHVFSFSCFTHNAVVHSQFGCVHSKKQTKSFWYLNFGNQNNCRLHRTSSDRSLALCTCMV